MANEGRKLPTKIKELRGTDRKDRQIDGQEVEFTVVQGLIPAPDILGQEGKDKWDLLIRECKAVGLISPVDLAALTMYCAAWERWLKAKSDLEAMEEQYFTTGTGYQQIRPHETTMQRAEDSVIKIGSLFGFNPVSRSRIAMPKGKPEKDEFADLYD